MRGKTVATALRYDFSIQNFQQLVTAYAEENGPNADTMEILARAAPKIKAATAKQLGMAMALPRDGRAVSLKPSWRGLP